MRRNLTSCLILTIVSNCKLYNQPSTVVYNICLEFEQYLKEFTNPEEVRDDPNTPGGKKRKRLAGGDHAWCIMAIETLKTHACCRFTNLYRAPSLGTTGSSNDPWILLR